MKKNVYRGFTAHSLKLIAAAAMLANHFAWLFLGTYSAPGQLLHVIERTTVPIMYLFIVQGYYQTHSHTRYTTRLAIFAVISQISYHYFMTGNLNILSAPVRLNVLFTLLFALLSLSILDRMRCQSFWWLGLVLLMSLASFGGQSVFIAIFTMIFVVSQLNPKRQMFVFTGAAAATADLSAWSNPLLSDAPPWGGFLQFGLLLAVPLLLRYSGQHGTSPAGKWFLYVFYPLRLIVLTVVHQFVIQMY